VNPYPIGALTELRVNSLRNPRKGKGRGRNPFPRKVMEKKGPSN